MTSGLDAARVPSLIDQYRQRHRAWLAQATELVRLRDEVRSAAEREAVEIVTAARRDVRRVVLQARRELLALAEQLKAAEDAADQSMPPGLPSMASPVGDGGSAGDAARTSLLTHARRDVRSVLDEARAEIDALVADTPDTATDTMADTVPSTAEPEDATDLPAVHALRLDEPADLAARLDALVIDTAVSSRGEGRSPSDPVRGVVAPFPAARPIEPAPPAPASPWTNEGASTFNPFATARLERPWAHAPEPDDEGLGPLPTVAALTEQVPTDDDGRPIPVIEPDVIDLSRPLDEDWFASPARPAQPLAPSDAGTSDERAPDSPAPHVGTPAAPDAVDHLGAHTPDVPGASIDAPDEPSPPLSGVFGSVDDSAGSTPSNMRRVIPIVGVGAFMLLTMGWFMVRGGRESAAPLEAAGVVERNPLAPSAAADVSPVDDSLSLIIEARRQAWIRATIDGQEEAGRVYKAGETRQIVGARSVAIQAGDAGAVFVAVGDGPSEPLGTSGAVATRRFSNQDPPRPRATTGETASRPASAPAASPSMTVPGRTGGAGAPAVTGRPAPVAAAAAAAAPPVTSSPAPAPARPADAASGEVGVARTDLVAAGQQWLDAYHRRDREGMSVGGSDAVKISDERSVVERFPAAQAGVKRDLDQVELELTGDTAVLTGRLTERADGPSPAGAPFVSRVSQIWVRRAGRWHLADVRIMGEGRLNQLVR